MTSLRDRWDAGWRDADADTELTGRRRPSRVRLRKRRNGEWTLRSVPMGEHGVAYHEGYASRMRMEELPTEDERRGSSPEVLAEMEERAERIEASRLGLYHWRTERQREERRERAQAARAQRQARIDERRSRESDRVQAVPGSGVIIERAGPGTFIPPVWVTEYQPAPLPNAAANTYTFTTSPFGTANTIVGVDTGTTATGVYVDQLTRDELINAWNRR